MHYMHVWRNFIMYLDASIFDGSIAGTVNFPGMVFSCFPLEALKRFTARKYIIFRTSSGTSGDRKITFFKPYVHLWICPAMIVINTLFLCLQG